MRSDLNRLPLVFETDIFSNFVLQPLPNAAAGLA
jgi:hypothetical protein